jgi:hypothetical protein
VRDVFFNVVVDHHVHLVLLDLVHYDFHYDFHYNLNRHIHSLFVVDLDNPFEDTVAYKDHSFHIVVVVVGNHRNNLTNRHDHHRRRLDDLKKAKIIFF